MPRLASNSMSPEDLGPQASVTYLQVLARNIATTLNKEWSSLGKPISLIECEALGVMDMEEGDTLLTS